MMLPCRIPRTARARAARCASFGAWQTGLSAKVMNTEDVLDEFRGAGALREGHFILSSGLHSGVFLQKNLVFQYPDRTERLCKALAAKIREAVGSIDLVISPAVGGIIPG